MSRKNPTIKDKLCAIDGTKARSFCHFEHKGMGGDPTNQRTDGFPACGTDHHGTSCHALYGQHHIRAWRDDIDGKVHYIPDEYATHLLRRRGVHCIPGKVNVAQYEDTDMDAIDARRLA